MPWFFATVAAILTLATLWFASDLNAPAAAAAGIGGGMMWCAAGGLWVWQKENE